MKRPDCQYRAPYTPNIRCRAALLGVVGALLMLLIPAVGFGQSAQRALDAIVAGEPTIAQVRAQILRANGWESADLDDWSSRARWSHLMPDLKGEVAWLDQRDVQARYREDLKSADNGLIILGGGQNNYYDDSRLRSIYAVTVRWNLSGLIYDSSEPRIAAEVDRRRRARHERLIEASDAYYARRRLQIHWLLLPSDQWRERLETQLEIDRYTARLDAMTQGWFSAEIARHDARNTPPGRAVPSGTSGRRSK